MIPSAAGLAADVVTDPYTALTIVGSQLPIVKSGINAISVSKPGQAVSNIMNTPLSFRRPISSVVDRSINKAIRPSVIGKSTFAQSQKYTGRARQAVKTIYENRGNIRFLDEAGNPIQKLPETLNEFSSAIQQTKESVFKQYDALAKQASGKGASIDLIHIANEVERGVSNKAIKTLYPQVRKYALDKATSLRKTGKFTPEDAQAAIKMLNNSLEAFYKNPNPETASHAVIDAGIANNLRKALDQAVVNATGEAYRPLKHAYASLLSIEKDVNRRAIVHARQNAKGLIDFTDIFAGSDIAQGILTMSPSRIATGVAKKGIAAYIKSINNPDRIIREMFRSVDKAAKKGFLIRRIP